MPLSTVSSMFSDSVPAWIVTGVILVGGFAYEQSSRNDERLATLETKTTIYEQDVREIKDGIRRVEDIIIGREEK